MVSLVVCLPAILRRPAKQIGLFRLYKYCWLLTNYMKGINFRTLDLWKIVTAPYYFRYQDRHGCEETLRALLFRCDRGVKQFSQRAQRLRGVRNVCPDKRKEPKPDIYFKCVSIIPTPCTLELSIVPLK